MGKSLYCLLDKDTGGGIFYKTSLIPVPGSGGPIIGAYFPGDPGERVLSTPNPSANLVGF